MCTQQQLPPPSPTACCCCPEQKNDGRRSFAPLLWRNRTLRASECYPPLPGCLTTKTDARGVKKKRKRNEPQPPASKKHGNRSLSTRIPGIYRYRVCVCIHRESSTFPKLSGSIIHHTSTLFGILGIDQCLARQEKNNKTMAFHGS